MNHSNSTANLLSESDDTYYDYTSIPMLSQSPSIKLNLGEMKHENLNVKSAHVPKQVTLSWTSLTIKAHIRSFLDTKFAFFNKKHQRKRHELILSSINGIVEPGQMLALMGPRYSTYYI